MYDTFHLRLILCQPGYQVSQIIQRGTPLAWVDFIISKKPTTPRPIYYNYVVEVKTNHLFSEFQKPLLRYCAWVVGRDVEGQNIMIASRWRPRCWRVTPSLCWRGTCTTGGSVTSMTGPGGVPPRTSHSKLRFFSWKNYLSVHRAISRAICTRPMILFHTWFKKAHQYW